MWGYVIRRVGQAVIVVIGVALVVFIMTRLLPGGPARAILGVRATRQELANWERQNGYDEPILLQFFNYLRQLLSGNLGFSYHLNQGVASLIAENLPKTLILVGTSTILALLIAVPLGIIQAIRRNRPEDYAITGFAFVLYSMPSFWLGLILISVFAIGLNWFPAIAPEGPISSYLSNWNGLVLPVATLTLITVASYSRYMRSSTLDSLVQDYIRTARAKGLNFRQVLSRHVLRNSLIPIVTLVGLSLPAIFSGALITETVYNYPGMGLLFFNSALERDYPTLLGVTLVVAIATVAGSLLADLLYAVVDPRVRY